MKIFLYIAVFEVKCWQTWSKSGEFENYFVVESVTIQFLILLILIA